MLSTTTRYFYDGVNEIVETDGSGDKLRYYIHGISYVDERLMMLDYKDTGDSTDDRPYYYTIDRMYNVRFLVDRAGALVERYMYDAYGRPHIRESCGRGDMNNETTLISTDSTRFTDAKNGTIWDPRADMDDDGDVDATDQTDFDTKVGIWPPPTFGAITVKQAFSDVGNAFMFQGRVHFALDTGASANAGKLMVNDHRARMNDPVTGRWITRDPLFYNSLALRPRAPITRGVRVPRSALRNEEQSALFRSYKSNPQKFADPLGLVCGSGITDPIVPDDPWGNDFTACCQRHDDCYGCCKPGGSKSQCDLAFLDCMTSVCENDAQDSAACHVAARAYYGAVDLYGDSAYSGAQSRLCNGGVTCEETDTVDGGCCSSSPPCVGVASGTVLGNGNRCKPFGPSDCCQQMAGGC